MKFLLRTVMTVDVKACTVHRDAHGPTDSSVVFLTENIITHIELLDFKFIDVHSMDRNSQFMRNPRTRRAVFYPF